MAEQGTITISGNPFDHSEHWRQSVPNADRRADCAWCGQRPARLFRYGEGRVPARITGPLFCNRTCARSYAG